MNDLNVKPSIYLSGPIEFSKDPETWRRKISDGLCDKYDLIIPDPIKCPYDKTDKEYGLWIRKNLILPDMGAVAFSTHTFVYLDNVYSSGTYGELSLASWLGKDITCFLDGISIERLPMWVIGCLSSAVFVNSIDEAIEHYKGK